MGSSEGSSCNCKVLCEHCNRSVLDISVSCNHSVTSQLFSVHSKIHYGMFYKEICLKERTFIKKQILHTLSGGVLSLFLLFFNSPVTTAFELA